MLVTNLIVARQGEEIAEEHLRRENVRRADNHLPVFRVIRHLVGAPHLRETGSTHDKHDHSGHVLHSGLGLVLVPVAVSGAAGRRLVVRSVLGTTGQIREVTGVQLVLDAILHDVLDHRRPTGHLVCLVVDALLPRHCVRLLAVALENIKYNQG